jgi:hypothetical protein
MGDKTHNPEKRAFKGKSYKKDGTKKGGKTIKEMVDRVSEADLLAAEALDPYWGLDGDEPEPEDGY